MASDVPLRSAGLPSQQQVIELLVPEFARAGYDVEDVLVQETLKPPRIVVVADGDDGLDLDAAAELSRSASELLDRLEESTGELAPYVLEVTSPGVDRPLTADRHFRRAQGRVVEMTLSDGSQLTGRLGALGAGVLRLVVADGGPGKYAVREIPRDAVAKAVVQVEFSPPNRRELELAGGQERSDPGNDAGGQERSDPGNDAGGQERSDPGKNPGGQRDERGKGIGTGQSGKEAEA